MAKLRHDYVPTIAKMTASRQEKVTLLCAHGNFDRHVDTVQSFVQTLSTALCSHYLRIRLSPFGAVRKAQSAEDQELTQWVFIAP